MGQARALKCLPEDRPNRRGCAPVRPRQSRRFKLERTPRCNKCCGKRRIVIAPERHFPQVAHPFRDNLPDLFANHKGIGGVRLAEFRFHYARILVNAAFGQVYMLQFHGSDGRIPCPGQQREGQQCPIPRRT